MDKKKIFSLSILDESNFGNRLQSFAIQRLIPENIYELNLLPIQNQRAKLKFSLYKIYFLIKNRGLYWVTESIIKKLFKRSKFSEKKHIIDLRKRNGEKFTKTNMNQFDSSIEEFFKFQNDEENILIIGSDQIFHPLAFKPHLKSFIQNFKGIKISFSASLGNSNIGVFPKEFWTTLSSFNLISFREKSVDGLRKKISQTYFQLPDPTLLIDPSVWYEMGKTTNLGNCPVKILDNKYALSYFVDNLDNQSYDNLYFAYKNSIGLEKHIILNDLKFDENYPISPNEFVTLIMNSSIIFTDSFHACCFASIFNIPVVILKLQRGKDNADIRIQNLSFGSKNFVIHNKTDLKKNIFLEPTYLYRDKIVKYNLNDIRKFNANFEKLSKLKINVSLPK